MSHPILEVFPIYAVFDLDSLWLKNLLFFLPLQTNTLLSLISQLIPANNLNLNRFVILLQPVRLPLHRLLALPLIKQDISLLVHNRVIATLADMTIVHLPNPQLTLYQVVATRTKA